MEIKRIKKEQILLNKLNGGLYEVIEVKTGITENGPRYRVGTAVRRLEDGVLDNSDWVTVTEENALCFRIVKDVKPEVPERYLLKDGILTLDGNSIEQGEIVVEQILAATNGNLLLIARRREEETAYVYRYETERDRFICICGRGKEASTIWNITSEDGQFQMIGWKEYSTEVKTDTSGNPILDMDGNPETEIQFDETVLITLLEGDVAATTKKMELEAPAVEVKNPDGYTFISLAPDGVPFVLFMNHGEYLVVQRSGITDFVFASRAYFHGCTGLSLLLVGTDELRFLGADHCDPSIICSKGIAEKISGYMTLVDVDQYSGELRYTLANDDYQLKTVVSRKTRDRGFVVRIDE